MKKIMITENGIENILSSGAGAILSIGSVLSQTDFVDVLEKCIILIIVGVIGGFAGFWGKELGKFIQLKFKRKKK